MMIFSTERGARKDADVQRSDFDHPACPCGRLAPFFYLHVESMYLRTIHTPMYVRILTQHSLSSRSDAVVCSPKEEKTTAPQRSPCSSMCCDAVSHIGLLVVGRHDTMDGSAR